MTEAQKNDGGPAFPCVDYTRPGDGIGVSIMTITGGMTLRDWFAGMALQGQADRFSHPHRHRELLANDCYDIADAMLAARNGEESK